LTHKMITALPRLLAVLTVRVDNRVLERDRHRLHPDGLIQERKVVAHVFHASHAERACVVLATTVFRVTRKMHDVTAAKTLERFSGIEEGIVADGAGSLEFLRDAAMVLVRQGHACIAPHAVSKINSQTLPHPARIAVGAVKYGTGSIVVEVANVAKVFGKSLFVELARFVDAELRCRL